MNDLLGKPFDPSTLVRCLLRHAQPRTGLERPRTSAPRAATVWPEIAGIRTEDVNLRLGGDLKLFRQLLRRFLDGSGEAPDIAPDERMDDAELAARLHRLKGTAATLGAAAIERLAAQAEDAGAQGHRALQLRLVRELRTQLRLLRDAAHPFVEQHAAGAAGMAGGAGDPAGAAAASLDPATLQQLIDTLARNDLSALERIESLEPQLRSRLGDSAVRDLKACVDALRFRDAAALLRSATLASA